MDLNKVKIFIKDQFPEFYREEFPAFVEFVTKYYEYLNTTDYSLMDSVKDVDSTLDEYVSVLKQDFAINIPQFGQLSDRDFLLFAKQFYTARGSQDSYRFLFRALYGKEIDIIYPGEQVLKPSDGVWNQEISIRVQSTPVSYTFSTGNTVLLSATDLTNKTFILQSQNGARSRLECVRVSQITENLYDIFINRNYSGVIAVGESFNYTARFEDINEQNQVDVIHLTLTGTIQETPAKIKVLQSGAGYTVGTLYTIPAETPLRFRIKKVDVTNNNKIIYTEIIQPGYDSGDAFEKHYIIDSTDRNLLIPVDDINTVSLTSTQSLLTVDFLASLKYPGLYTSSRGFLSDTIKLHDSNYYQSFSYVIRLDEQLESYKNIVKRLLHPAGMSLWAEYNISNNIDIRATIANIIEVLRLFVEDDVFPLDNIALLFNLAREDIVSVDIYALDYFAETGVNAYTQEGDQISFDIVTPKSDIVESPLDNGLLTNGDETRILYSGIVRPVDGDTFKTVESGQLIVEFEDIYALDYFAEETGINAYCIGTQEQIRNLYDGILRPVDGDEVFTTDSSAFEITAPITDNVLSIDVVAFNSQIEFTDAIQQIESGSISISGTQTQTIPIHNGILRPTNDIIEPTHESGYLELIPGTITTQDYCDPTYFAQDYCRGGTEYRILHTGILRPENDSAGVSESGKLVLQSYNSADIYAQDYVDQDNDQTYAYGNEEVFRTIYSGLTRPVDDNINLVDSLSIVSDKPVDETIDIIDQLEIGIQAPFQENISPVDQLEIEIELPNSEFIVPEESGKLVLQSYASQDIYAQDYVDQENDGTYAYGNEEVFRTIFSGIVNIPKDQIVIADSGKLVLQSYASQDIYAQDYVDQENDGTYAYGNESNIVVF
jgi:hypothetical protein